VIHVFTSASLNYLGKVRALFESVREHHAGLACHLVAVEDAPRVRLDADHEPFDDITFVTDLGPGRRRSWLFGHSLVELATAIKPHFARRLLADAGCEGLLYLDPDIVVFSPLDDVLAALSRTSIALTPHLLAPESERQAILDNEVGALRHGVFNLGFLALRNTGEARRFVTWWADRTTHFCMDALAEGLFTDQKWIDLAPGFFPELVVLRSPRLNVAPWNLTQRRLRGTFDEGFTVDDEPLGFYHFTGFDPGAHQTMTRKYAPGNLAVQMLIDWYEGYTAARAPDGGWTWTLGTYEDGEPIAPAHRRIYRQREDLQARFPDPYASGAGSYREWLAAEGAPEPVAPRA
jgi:hypothetical protein